MSIRFKFRSSVNFDAVDIGSRASISVRELRAKILHGKNSQQQQQGFDLVFSDADTGLEFKGDDSQIPKGSSVIVKRVPGGTVPSAVSPVEALKNNGMKESHTVDPTKRPMDKLDDFGADLCMMPDSNLPPFDIEIDTNKFTGNEMQEIVGMSMALPCISFSPLGSSKRGAFLGSDRLQDQGLYSSDPNQAIPRGCDRTGNGRNNLPEARADEQMKFNKSSTPNIPALQNANLPLELKCSLCNSFFKEAVMIPCCQHSFCDKCIRVVLLEEKRCPKCLSSKCRVEDLLPNLSLRQAIQHFRESELLDAAALEKAMQKYVPDGESGIQAKEFSCGLTVAQKELEMPQLSSATGRGSNQVFMGSYYERKHQRRAPYGDSDFQGDNLPSVVPQAYLHDEANSNNKRTGGFWIGTGAGDGSFFPPGGHKRGVRACYTCGSPEHLMRDCPVSNQNPMVQPGNGAFHGGMPGYAPPYWNGSSFPPFTPYSNMYGNPSMMPFNGSMVPVSPFAVPPYIPSMYAGLPGAGGNMRMGNMGPPRYSEFFGLQPCENRRKPSNEILESEQLSDNRNGSSGCYRRTSPERSHDYRLEKHKESSLSHSGDSFTQRPGRKSHNDKYVDSERHEKSSHCSFVLRDKRPHHAERSNSGNEHVPKGSDRHSDGRHKHNHGESKKYHDRRGNYESDSSFGNHSAHKKDVKRKIDSDARGSHKRHHSSSESGFEPSSLADRRKGYKERDEGHGSRHHRHRDKHHGDRRHTSSGSDEERRDEYRHQKRKRVY